MRLLPTARWLLILPALGCLGLVTLLSQERKQETVVRRGILIVADGAGDVQAATDGFARAFCMADLPWNVERFHWTAASPPSSLKDLKNAANHHAKGALLAQAVMDYRCNCPNLAICLAGYSSGCAVVLAAADSLPLDSVDRIILLAPSVSVYYDLRPSLLCSRCGVNVFYSKEDGVYHMLSGMISPPDYRGAPWAGAYGFFFEPCPGEEALACKLRQYYWHPGIAWTGHRGKHGDYVKPKFLDYAVLPLLVEASLAPAHR